MHRLGVLLLCAGLSACSVNSYCLVEQDYQKARVAPELKAGDGLAVPNSPSALRLPPKPGQNEPFGRRADDGSGVCLDRPPPFTGPKATPGA